MTPDELQRFVREDRMPVSAELFSLRDVIDRGVKVHWDEAVAVVEEFCVSAIEAAGENSAVPELDDVLFGGDGRVSIRRTRGDTNPAAAGRMLHALLSNAEVPMALRLFITQSTAQDAHRSLREFASGLAYFGKPDRRRLVQDVHARCLQARPGGAGVPAAAPPPLPKLESESPASARQSSKRRIAKWAFAVAACGIAGSGVWLWNGGRSAHEVQGSAARVLSEAADVVVDLGEQVRNAFNSTAAAPAAAAVTSNQRREGVRPVRRRSTPAADRVEAAPRPLASRQLLKRGGGSQLSVAVPNTVGFEPPAADDPTTLEGEQATVYSSADRDVEPPVLLLPQLTPPLARTGASTVVNRMTLVVSPEGTVERVQLVEGPARMIDMMLLSGAKTWRFTPAFKDGEPVRYRAVISWAVNP
jgi:hypothetical protein